MTNESQFNIEMLEDDLGEDQDILCTDLEDSTMDDSIPDQRNDVNHSMSENTKTDELNISQEKKKAGCPSKKKKCERKCCNFPKNRANDNCGVASDNGPFWKKMKVISHAGKVTSKRKKNYEFC